MCAIDDAEYNTFTDRTVVCARRCHGCIECGRAITRGEWYLREKSLYDGHWRCDRTCAHCHSAGSWMFASCGGWLVGGLLDELLDHWSERVPDGHGRLALGRLIIGGKRRWRRRDGALMPIPNLFTLGGDGDVIVGQRSPLDIRSRWQTAEVRL